MYIICIFKVEKINQFLPLLSTKIVTAQYFDLPYKL